VSAPVPTSRSLDALREAVHRCRACPLWEPATQAVFGEGLKRSELVLVGEQPGDREDVEGRPFVGPAGRVLDEALEQAGIARSDVYVTNVVKHFKYRRRGKRRIHQKPDAAEIGACRPWLDSELKAVQPTALMALGATAAQALFGRQFRVTRQRGELIDSGLAPIVSATWHPSAILRAPDEEARAQSMRELTADLANVARTMAARGGAAC
jgi:uracil-DNA glycosylase